MPIPETQKEKINSLVKGIIEYMNLDCRVDLREESIEKNTLLVSVYVPERASFLIGKNGQNLSAIEHIVRSIILKSEKEIGTILVDVNDYRKSRSNYIIDIAKHAVMRVRNTQRAETLSPMPPHERRIVHMELASYPDIATESIGDDPQRRIIIKPYP